MTKFGNLNNVKIVAVYTVYTYIYINGLDHGPARYVNCKSIHAKCLYHWYLKFLYDDVTQKLQNEPIFATLKQLHVGESNRESPTQKADITTSPFEKLLDSNSR